MIGFQEIVEDYTITYRISLSYVAAAIFHHLNLLSVERYHQHRTLFHHLPRHDLKSGNGNWQKIDGRRIFFNSLP